MRILLDLSRPRHICPSQPFVEPDQLFHSFFPDRYWAVAIPVGLLIVAVTFVGCFLGSVMVKQQQHAKAAKAS